MSVDMTDADMAMDPRTVVVEVASTPAHVIFATEAGTTDTLEGLVDHGPGDALVTGAIDEHWPIGREHFERLYAPVAPLLMGEAGLYRKRARRALALRMDRAFTVRVADGANTLTGAAGDWLVCYGDGHRGIVQDGLFDARYRRTP